MMAQAINISGGRNDREVSRLLADLLQTNHTIILLDSNTNEACSWLAAGEAVTTIPGKDCKGKHVFGFISYDFKNSIEQLNTNCEDMIGFPDSEFVNPSVLVRFEGGGTEVLNAEPLSLRDGAIRSGKITKRVHLKPRISKSEYLRDIAALQAHIRRGNIYEVNYCQEFYAQDTFIDPLAVYEKLRSLSPNPFSCYVRYGHAHLLCVSPERFLKKKGSHLISQPIKGTAQRHEDDAKDAEGIRKLLSSEKERSENIMIVDLVRNDFSRIAKKDTVVVEKLFELQSYPFVHQMVSTVGCRVGKDRDFEEIIRATFPMGSMTGAPKIRAMKLIDYYEHCRRGLFSGTVGHIDDGGDFDFNVVIRSILYNDRSGYISCIFGGAITAASVPESEYRECLVKARPVFEALGDLGTLEALLNHERA